MDGGAGASGSNNKSELYLNSECKFITPIKRVVHHCDNNVTQTTEIVMGPKFFVHSIEVLLWQNEEKKNCFSNTPVGGR